MKLTGRNFLIGLSLLFIFPYIVKAQVDDVGSGRVLDFDGVDDYVDLGNIYDDLKLPISIEAWIFIDPQIVYAFPVFNSQDNLPFYNGITFLVTPTHLSIQYGDGQGEDNPAFRRGKGATISSMSGKWTHVSAVMRSALDMDLFVNGVDVGGTYNGSSDLPMSSNSSGDVAKIGYWHSNGQTFYFNGKIDELRLWKRSLTINDIRQRMCQKLQGSEADLIGYWNFDEVAGSTLFDRSTNEFHGTIKGNAFRYFSGAPIGDKSIFSYPNTWLNSFVEMTDASDHFLVNNVQGSPDGIHIYEVKDLPSQRGNLSLDVGKPYFGVFAAASDDDNIFDVQYDNTENPSCKIFNRTDNSKPMWTETAALLNVSQRIEVIKVAGNVPVAFDLGSDQNLCDQATKTLTTGMDASHANFLWSTGESSPSIDVSESGIYWVKVSGNCKAISDTIRIGISQTPSAFSLGYDETICEFTSKILKPFEDADGLDFTWQNGATTSSFEAKDFGVYWVEVKNFCGSVSDTVLFTKAQPTLDFIPNIITPDGNGKNDVFIVNRFLNDQPTSITIFNRWGQKVYHADDYKNDWNGGDLAVGVYFYSIFTGCMSEKKGFLYITR